MSTGADGLRCVCAVGSRGCAGVRERLQVGLAVEAALDRRALATARHGAEGLLLHPHSFRALLSGRRGPLGRCSAVIVRGSLLRDARHWTALFRRGGYGEVDWSSWVRNQDVRDCLSKHLEGRRHPSDR